MSQEFEDIFDNPPTQPLDPVVPSFLQNGYMTYGRYLRTPKKEVISFSNINEEELPLLVELALNSDPFEAVEIKRKSKGQNSKLNSKEVKDLEQELSKLHLKIIRKAVAGSNSIETIHVLFVGRDGKEL